MSRPARLARARRARQAAPRVELRIGRLVIDDPGIASPDALIAAMTAQLRAVLARELAAPGLAEELAHARATRLRATVSLPPAADSGAGRAIGITLARAVTGPRDHPRQPGGAR